MPTHLDRPHLQGQVALVTGGGRGIGRACAEALAGAGAAVGVVARSHDEVAETARRVTDAGGRATAVAADVSDPDAVRRMVQTIEARLGPVDLLLNNAAVGRPIGPTWETDPALWWRNIEVNVRGPFLCCHTVLAGMVARGRGRIINVATGMRSLAYLSAYLSGKAALVRFSETLAAEVKPHGISVFSIHPGTVRTQMSQDALTSAEGQKWLSWFAKMFEDAADVSSDRAASLVLLIASGQADALTGRYLSVYDDLSAVLARSAEIERADLLTLRLRTLS